MIRKTILYTSAYQLHEWWHINYICICIYILHCLLICLILIFLTSHLIIIHFISTKVKISHCTPYLILLSSGDMAPVVLVAAVTSILVTGCVEPAAAPSTWPVSLAPPVSASCPLGRSVDSLRIGSFVCHTMKWWWKTSSVLRKMVSL